MKKNICLAILSAQLIYCNAYAQRYATDQDGYIADTAFHRILKNKGVRLAGRFTTAVSDSNKKVAWVKTIQGWTIIDNSGEFNKRFPASGNGNNKVYVEQVVAPEPSYTQGIVVPHPSKMPQPDFNYHWKNGKIGTVNKEGKTGIPVIFDHADNIGETATLVKLGNKWGVYLRDGKLLVPVEYDGLRYLVYEKQFRTDLFIVTKNNQSTLINNKGKLVIPFGYDIIQPTSDPGCFIATKNKRSRLISDKGKILSGEYERIEEDAYNTRTLKYAAPGESGKKGWGLISTSGKVITGAVFDEIKRFSAKYSVVAEGTGSIHKETLVENASGQKNGKSYCFIETPLGNFSKVTVNCHFPGNIGFMDTTGKEVIPTIYTEIGNFNSIGMAIVNTGDLWNSTDSKGVLAQNGKLIVQPVFRSIDIHEEAKTIAASKNGMLTLFDFDGRPYFSDKPYGGDIRYAGNNTYSYRYKGTSGIFDKSGQLLLETTYDRLEPCGENYKVESKGKFGLINNKGRLLVPVIYKGIYSCQNRFFAKNIVRAYRDRKEYLVDLYGNEIPAEEEPSFD